MKKASILFLLFFAYGCVTPQPQSQHLYAWLDIVAQPQVVENSYIAAKLTPIEWMSNYDNRGGYKAFYLEIKNKTSTNIELDWNKTSYIEKGQTKGGVMFEGVIYRERNAPKQPDIIFANTDFAKKIWPNILVDFTSGRYGGWKHSTMPVGQNGIYLTIKVGDKEINEKIIVNMRYVPAPAGVTEN